MKLVRLPDNKVRLILSERNLRSLLAKLEGHPPNSARTLVSPEADFVVEAESDAEHYAQREPGPMHPMTEIVLRARS